MKYQDQFQKRIKISQSMIRIENLIHMMQMVYQIQLPKPINPYHKDKSQADGLKIKRSTKEYQNL